MDEMARHKKGDTQKRWERAMREKPFDMIRAQVLIQTKSQDFLDVMANGTVCTNIFLRRLHNFALEMDWIAKAMIPRRQWPKIEFESKQLSPLKNTKESSQASAILNGACITTCCGTWAARSQTLRICDLDQTKSRINN
jgi:hypothetical protein